MSYQESSKNVPIYFYYLAIERQKDKGDDSVYDMKQIVGSFSKLLQYVYGKDLIGRRVENKDLEKIIWLDSFNDLGNGNYDIVFKSAKYNHVRNEIDTVTMKKLGKRKQKQDGDEEKTHLCIRLSDGQKRFLVVHESNRYGISISCIVSYLNTQFEKYNEDSDDKYHYKLSYDVMPGYGFLEELKNAKTITLLKLTVSRHDMKDDFMIYANREDVEIDEDVDVCMRRPRGVDKFPENLIKTYYDDFQNNKQIKRIAIKCTNSSGADFEVNTDLIKMKRCLLVKPDKITNEVNSKDFFIKAQNFIDEARK